MFDGVVYAEAGTETIHDGSELHLEFLFKYEGAGSLGAKRDFGLSGKMEFFTRFYSGTSFEIGFSDDGTNTEAETFTISNVDDGRWHTLKITFNSGNITLDLDDNIQTSVIPVTNIYQGTGNLYVGSSGSYIPFNGAIAYARLGNAEFKFAEGDGLTLYNTGTAGGNANLIGATLPDFWGTDYSYLREIKDGYGAFTGNEGVTWAGTSPYSSTYLEMELIWKPTSFDTDAYLLGKYNIESARSAQLYQRSSSILSFYFSSDGTSSEYVNLSNAQRVQLNQWNVAKVIFDNGHITFTLNGHTEEFDAVTHNTLYTDNTTKMRIGHYYNTPASGYSLKGNVAYAKMGSKEFTFNELSGDTVSGGTIVNYYDGFWQSSNLKLVESNCLTGDGTLYAQRLGDLCGLTSTNLTNKNIKVTFWIELNTDVVGSYFTKTNDIATTNNELAATIHTNGYFYFTFFGLSGSFLMGTLADNKIHKVEYIYSKDTETFTLYVDDVQKASSSGALTINDSYDDLYIFKYRYGEPAGKMAGVTVTADGEEIFALPMAEGDGLVTYTTNGEAFQLVGATLPDAWANTQNERHPNLLNGFSNLIPMETSYAESTEVSNWTINLKRILEPSTDIIVFMAQSAGLSNGYALQVESTVLYLRKFVAGAPTTLVLKPAYDYTIDHNLIITRDTSGEFNVWDNGELIFTVTDTTFTTSNYFYIRRYSGLRYASSITAGGNELFNFVKVPAKSATHDALGFELTNPSGKWHNLAETKMKLADDTTLESICSGLTTNIFYEETADGMLVTGAGTTVVNDNYSYAGEYDGHPFYQSAGGYEIIWVSTKWRIREIADIGNSPYISNNGDVATPDLCVWQVNTGLAPTPTVTAQAGGFEPIPFHPDDFGGAFDLENLHKIFILEDDYKAKYLLFYSVAKTEDEIQKILKCGLKGCDFGDYTYTRNEEGKIILDENGKLVLTEGV